LVQVQNGEEEEWDGNCCVEGGVIAWLVGHVVVCLRRCGWPVAVAIYFGGRGERGKLHLLPPYALFCTSLPAQLTIFWREQAGAQARRSPMKAFGGTFLVSFITFTFPYYLYS
jgi:hypothetical protein